MYWIAALFLLALTPKPSLTQSPCSMCQSVAEAVIGSMAAEEEILRQREVIKAAVCPSLQTSFDCVGQIESGLWDQVVVALNERQNLAKTTCDAVRCGQWGFDTTRWSCESCRLRVGEVGSATSNSSAISFTKAYLTGDGLCQHEEECVTFLEGALQPSLRVIAEYTSANSRGLCDTHFSNVCSRAKTECEPRMTNMINLLTSQDEVAKQQELLLEEVCAGEEVTGDGRQEECNEFVNQEWSNIMAAVAQEVDMFAKDICYSLEVSVVPTAWNCLTCEKELRAFTRHFYASVESLSEFLSGDAYCAGASDPAGCATQIGLFLELAVPSLAEALASNARTYCNDYSDCQ